MYAWGGDDATGSRDGYGDRTKLAKILEDWSWDLLEHDGPSGVQKDRLDASPIFAPASSRGFLFILDHFRQNIP